MYGSKKVSTKGIKSMPMMKGSKQPRSFGFGKGKK